MANSINNGEIWMEMLENRNLLSHTYQESTFDLVVDKIVNVYYIQIESLVSYFNSQL